uniref:Chromo shadow domain-containing protein n=1 Tax=Megaselia scalaris TaxID=36166 RepID=T1H6J8_MEGSC
IVGAAVHPSGDVMYLVKWKFCDEFDMVSANLKKNPEILLEYFQEKCPYQKKAIDKTKDLPEELRSSKAYGVD